MSSAVAFEIWAWFPGRRFKFRAELPSKDPVAIRVRDFTLTLRNNEADHILVDVNESS